MTESFQFLHPEFLFLLLLLPVLAIWKGRFLRVVSFCFIDHCIRKATPWQGLH